MEKIIKLDDKIIIKSIFTKKDFFGDNYNIEKYIVTDLKMNLIDDNNGEGFTYNEVEEKHINTPATTMQKPLEPEEPERSIVETEKKKQVRPKKEVQMEESDVLPE